MSITAFPGSLSAVFTMCFVYKGHTHHPYGFDCNVNDKENPKTCLANHKSSITHHITPLVINSLGGGHTRTSILTSWTKAISRNQAHASLQFKKNTKKQVRQYKVIYAWCVNAHMLMMKQSRMGKNGYNANVIIGYMKIVCYRKWKKMNLHSVLTALKARRYLNTSSYLLDF